MICKLSTKDVESLLRKRDMAMILSGKARMQNVLQYEGDHIL